MRATAVARRIGASLDEAELRYAIGGALALGVWGAPRMTNDVDLSIFAPVPRFINEAGGNYHLDPSSPAADVATTGPAEDIDGDVRPQGAGWDLGFDEMVP